MKEMTTEELLKEIEEKHNNSLFEEIFKRRDKELYRTALFYKGTKINYLTLKYNVIKYAKALKAYGIKKGDEIPICMANTPEFIYLLGGISLIGAKANIFGEGFDKDYITEIINGCNSDILFATDDKYSVIDDSVKKSKNKRIVLISLTESLLNGKNPYIKLEKKWYDFKDRRNEIKDNSSRFMFSSEFLNLGKEYKGNYIEKVNLDDEFTITYSSGSTNSSRPKAIVHDVKSYIVMGIYHDPKISKVPSMKNLRMLAHIPTHSNTNIMSCITDPLMQGSEIAVEPIYTPDHFVYSLLINKPSFVTATRSFFVRCANDILNNKKFKNVKMPFLLVPMIVGEPNSIGEEKFCNKFLRKVNAGSKFTHSPLSPVVMSMAGGDCEHGGLFFVLFKEWQRKKLNYLLKKEDKGLRTYNMVHVDVLDKFGNSCEPGEIGRVVANSPCTMLYYKNNPEATDKFFIKDSLGKVWGDCCVYGYKDKYGEIHMKGRINSEDKIQPFQIADTVLKDTKNILSCEVIKIEDKYVIHFVAMPDAKIKDTNKLIMSIYKRCLKIFGKEITSQFVFNKRNEFPLSGCGKRNNIALTEEGIPNNSLIVVSGLGIENYTVENNKKKIKKL